MKKAVLALAAVLLVPCFVFAQPDAMDAKEDLQKEQKHENVTLGDEAQEVQKGIVAFKAQTARTMSNKDLDLDTKINFITENLMIQVMDKFDDFDKSYNEKVKAVQGTKSSVRKITELTKQYSLERNQLINELASPLADVAMLALFGCAHLERIIASYDEASPLADGTEWLDFVSDNLDRMGHWYTVAEPIKRFVLALPAKQ